MTLVLDWTAEVKLWFVGCHLECAAKPCGGTVIEITPSLREILVPKQVSGLWFHGFLGLSHVTFSG